MSPRPSGTNGAHPSHPSEQLEFDLPDRYDRDVVYALVRFFLIDTQDNPPHGAFLDVIDQHFPTLRFCDFRAAIALTNRIARRAGLQPAPFCDCKEDDLQ